MDVGDGDGGGGWKENGVTWDEGLGCKINNDVNTEKLHQVLWAEG